MKKVCINFFTLSMTLTLLWLLWTNDIRLVIFDILIAIVLFLILYNLHFYIGKYIKVRKERQKFDLIVKSLEKCIERQNIR